MAFSLSRAMSGAGGALKDTGLIGFRQTMLEDRAARQREWQSGENEKTRQAAATEAEKGREFTKGENTAARTSNETIAKLGRDTQTTLAKASRDLQIELAKIRESADTRRHGEVMARMEKQYDLAQKQLAQGGVKIVNTKDGMAVTYSGVDDAGNPVSKVVPLENKDGSQVQPGTVDSLPAIANALSSASLAMAKFMDSPAALSNPKVADMMTKQMQSLSQAANSLLSALPGAKATGEPSTGGGLVNPFANVGATKREGPESAAPKPAAPAPAQPTKPGIVRGSMGSSDEFDSMLADAQRGGETGQSYLREKLKYNELSLGQRQAAEAALR